MREARCEECRAPWPSPPWQQCQRCGNRTWEWSDGEVLRVVDHLGNHVESIPVEYGRNDVVYFGTAEELLEAVFPPVRPDPTRGIIESDGPSESHDALDDVMSQRAAALDIADACVRGHAINSRGELIDLDTPFARMVARSYNVPDHVIGIPSPWWRRLVQRVTRR